ncbi:MAG: hypothetical protein GY852_04770 [bacterium]|nr:hypothetical protein [bacterium]
MFSLYRGRFKRAPQRAIRARGYTANFKSLISSVAGAVQGVGKSSKGRTLKDKGKALKGKKGEIKGTIRQGRKGIKGGQVKTVVGSPKGRGGSQASGMETGAAGKAGGLDATRGTMEIGEGSEVMLKQGAYAGAGGFAKAFGAQFGSAFLAKLLTGSGLTSWLVYGTGEDFKGTRRAITDKLEASHAPVLQKQLANLVVQIDMKVTVATGKDGKPLKGPNGETLYIVSYNDVSAVDPKKSTIVMGADNPDAQQCPVVESKPLTAAEVEKAYAEVVAPVMMLGASSSKIVTQSMMEQGNVLHDAQQNAVAAGSEIYGVSVSEPISADVAGTIVTSPDQKISGSDAAAAIIKADSLTTSGGARITDGQNFSEWVNGLNAQVQGGQTISSSELRMGAEIYHKAVDQFGAEAVATDTNLAALGTALVGATSPGPQAGEPTSESAGLGLYVNSMVADANTQAAADLSSRTEADRELKQQVQGAQANAMAALGANYDAAVALEAQGEGGKTNLGEMMDSFGAEGRGEMGDPSRYNDNEAYRQSTNGHLMEHQAFMLQNDIDTGNTAVGEYLSTTMFSATPPKGGFESNEAFQEASRGIMVDALDPNREGRHALQSLNPDPGAGKAKPWRMNEAQYAAKIETVQGSLEKSYLSEQHQELIPEAVRRFLPPETVLSQIAQNADAAARQTGVNPDGTRVAGNVPNITMEHVEAKAEEVYAGMGIEVDFAAARETAKKKAAEDMAPLTKGYQKPRDDIALKSREGAYNTVNGAIGARPGSPPVESYGRDASQHDLYLALGANPQHSRRVSSSMKKEFDEVRKVEAANREKGRLESLRAQRQADFGAGSQGPKPPKPKKPKKPKKKRRGPNV